MRPTSPRSASVPRLSGVVGAGVALLTLLLTGTALAVPGAASAAAPARQTASHGAPVTSLRATATPRAQSGGVVQRRVSFDVVNSNESLLPCSSDNREHVLRGTLVGPAQAVRHGGPHLQVNVLLHDAGTGGWFWHLRSQPRYDYALQLARHGQTSLVLDRLGYDASPLADGNATCLGAQAMMVHEVVQELYSGKYRVQGAGRSPSAAHVVLQGHGTGSTVAQLEAASFGDVRGLVLMSTPTTSPSAAALQVLRQQGTACGSGASYAAFGTVADFRHLLFRTAPASVQRAATVRRNPTPCGDVSSIVTAVLAATTSADQVDVPVLWLDGSADTRGQHGSYGASGQVTTRVIKGAGSALPLERSAPTTRRIVLHWLGTLRGF